MYTLCLSPALKSLVVYSVKSFVLHNKDIVSA